MALTWYRVSGIVGMDQEDTLATHVPGQDPDLDPVLAALSNAEGEEVGEILTENEDTLTVAHRVDLEAGAEVGTVICPVGEVGGAISPPHDRDDDCIPGVQVHIWIS